MKFLSKNNYTFQLVFTFLKYNILLTIEILNNMLEISDTFSIINKKEKNEFFIDLGWDDESILKIFNKYGNVDLFKIFEYYNIII